MCPACVGADLRTGKEADLTAPTNNYTAGKGSLDIPAPEISVDDTALLDTPEAEELDALDIPAPQQDRKQPLQMSI